MRRLRIIFVGTILYSRWILGAAADSNTRYSNQTNEWRPGNFWLSLIESSKPVSVSAFRCEMIGERPMCEISTGMIYYTAAFLLSRCRAITFNHGVRTWNSRPSGAPGVTAE